MEADLLLKDCDWLDQILINKIIPPIFNTEKVRQTILSSGVESEKDFFSKLEDCPVVALRPHLRRLSLKRTDSNEVQDNHDNSLVSRTEELVESTESSAEGREQFDTQICRKF